MITRPLELESRLSPPPRDLDFVAWVNVGTIVLFFSLLGSPFVLAPGPVIELPRAGVSAVGTGTASVVVTYRRDDVILFEGGMYTLPALRKHLDGYVKKHPGAVMLVRADRQVSMQAFFELCDMAKEMGFAYVQSAAEPPAAADPIK